MSSHPWKCGSQLLLAVVSVAALAVWSRIGSAAAAAEPSDDPAWPVAAVADPLRLGVTVEGLRALDDRMNEAVIRGEIAGISYGLVKDAEVAAFRFLGKQSLDGPPMQEDTIFRIRSTGKTITAVAMMQLWEQGKWKPEDPVSKFLPELAHLEVATSSDSLDRLVPVSHTPTMHEVMTHTAGFGYGLAINNAVDRAYRAQDVLRARNMKTLIDLVAHIPLVSQPGERWHYSVTYDLQGAIIERITGKKLGEYLEARIFKPLAMKDTSFRLAEADRPRLATVYTRNATTGSLEVLQDAANFLADDPFAKGRQFESGGGGASGLFSTLHDVVRFTTMLLDKGELGGRRILKPATVDFMMQNHIGDLRGVLGGDYGFGYGGRVVLEGSTERMPQPSGAFSHFSIEGAWFWVDPANRLSFVGLIQRRGAAAPGAVAMGGEGDAARLVYKALAK